MQRRQPSTSPVYSLPSRITYQRIVDKYCKTGYQALWVGDGDLITLAILVAHLVALVIAADEATSPVLRSTEKTRMVPREMV